MLALIHHHSFLNETARLALAKCESYASDLSVPGSACRYLHNIRTGEDPRPRVWRERFSTADLPDSRSPRGCAFKFNPRLRYSTSSVHRTFVNRWDSPLSAFVYGLPSSDPHGSDLPADVWAVESGKSRASERMGKRLLAGNPGWLDIGAPCFGDPVLGKVRGGDLVDLVSALVSSGLSPSQPPITLVPR